MNWISRFVFLMILNSYTKGSYAEGQSTAVGHIAQDLLDAPVSYTFTFVTTLCLILGGSFLFAGIVKYIEHRRNPMIPSISTVIFLFVMGILLILLALLSIVAETGGMRYTL